MAHCHAEDAMRLSLLAAVVQERHRQDTKFGPVEDYASTRDGTGPEHAAAESAARAEYASDWRHHNGTWRTILLEEVAEAIAAKDEAALRTELIQVAAVALRWVEAIDVRRERR